MKKVIVLGASGSIGGQTIDILLRHPEEFSIVGLSVNNNTSKINEFIDKAPSIKSIAICSGLSIDKFRKRYKEKSFFEGENSLIDLIRYSNADIVVNALVGFAGLVPSVETLKLNKTLCLANKETLVVGGELINSLLDSGHGKLFPIDSEHVAIAKCLKNSSKDVSCLLLTASGGSFRKLKREELKNVSVNDALNHPTWNMGAKITIDSATMMNKGFEIMEAYYLFHFPQDKIQVIMHDESIVHSLVRFVDGSYLGDFGPADMRIPIQYALFEGKRTTNDFNEFNLDFVSELHFHPFDKNRYPLVSLARKVLSIGGSAGACLNAANEEAVNAFLNHEIPFIQIEMIVSEIVNGYNALSNPSLEELVQVDKEIRLKTRKLIEKEIL